MVFVIVMNCFDLTEPWFAEDDIKCTMAVKYLKPAWGTDATDFDGSKLSAHSFDLGTASNTDTC